jgi:hypothetical protein
LATVVAVLVRIDLYEHSHCTIMMFTQFC